MKKTIFLLAILLGSVTLSNAQVSFKPGVRGGLNFSHFTKGNDYFYDSYYGNNITNREFTSRTSFYLGLFGDLKLSKFYSLQPELNLSNQGATENFISDNKSYSRDYNISYLSLGIANKFTFNKFNVHVGPAIDFVVDSKVSYLNVNNNYNYNDWYNNSVDLAFFLGAGYDITNNFGVEARIKKGIIPVMDSSDGNHTNVVISAGAFYKFDVK